jgi:hypothetical protein
MVASEKISGKSSMNVSRLPIGNYLLKLTDKNGNIEVSQFIKKIKIDISTKENTTKYRLGGIFGVILKVVPDKLFFINFE